MKLEMIREKIALNSEKDEKINEGSSLTLNQFRFIFIFFVHKMKLPLNQRDN